MSRTISERLARLKRLRGSLAKDVAALEQEIAALEVDFKPRKEAARPTGARLNEGTVGDAAETVLRQAKRPLYLTDIVNEIGRRGLYRTNSKNPALDACHGAEEGATVRAGRTWTVSLDPADTDASTGPEDSPLGFVSAARVRAPFGSFLQGRAALRTTVVNSKKSGPT